MEIKSFGFFDEMKHGDQELRDRRRDVPHPEEARILAYLRSGTGLIAVACTAHDLLNGEPIGAPDVFTDGDWCWSAELPYYVERYHIQLPEEFVERMRDNEWKPPKVEDCRSIVKALGWH